MQLHSLQMMQPQLLLLLLLISALAVLSPTQAQSTGTNMSLALPLGSFCADGSIPLNSIQVRCDTTPQVHWAGRKCDNVTYSCPNNYVCTGFGACCSTGSKSAVNRNLCSYASRSNPPATIEKLGSCSSDADCVTGRSYQHKCCSGKCVIYAPNCHRMLSDYLQLQSTGKMPRQHLPICKSDGSYARIQSDPRFGISWCVNETTGIALRSGCCLPQAKPHICPPGQKVHACPRDMCSMHVCISHPTAKCRVNPCGSGCSVEFVDSQGRIVNCSSSISGCAAKMQQFFTTLSRMHRWDQTIPEQHYHLEDAADASSSAAADDHLHECEKSLCVRYNSALLEPASSAVSTGNRCPFAQGLGHRCSNKCSRNSCPSDKRCCFTGCGRECVKTVAMATSESCSAVISSGHCPSSGCHRMCKMFGWDAAKGRCRPFWFAGAGGNNNRYYSWSECMYAIQNCHTDVLISLPWRPSCLRNSIGNYARQQWSDNGFSWCTDASGNPTAGSLHAANIVCNRDGSLVQDNFYVREEQKYKATCPNGKQPSWCHTVSVNASCQAPGVMTFADACNSCKIVHINEDGEKVTCPTARAVCSAGVDACTSPIPRYSYNVSADACGLAPTGSHSCGGKGQLADHKAFSREDYCLHACTSTWCGGSAHRFYPDLCVQPSCSRKGAVCVADDCNGMERYYFLENGTEVTECRRSTQPLDLAVIAGCGSTPASPGPPHTQPQPPSTRPPVTRPPVTRPPVTRPPGTGPSGTRPPVTRPPGTGPPVTRPPGTGASGTRPPVTRPPGTGPPVTRPSSTGPPGTRPSGTGPPVTRPPTTTTTLGESTEMSEASETTRAPTSTSTPSTAAPGDGSSGLCRLQSLLLPGNSYLVCSSNGQYLPKQCNTTHCYCVVTDSGVVNTSISAVPISRAASLICPNTPTTDITLDLSFEANFDSLLPTTEDRDAFKRDASRQLSSTARLQPKHVGILNLTAGSIVVTVQMKKELGDPADLPAAAFQLKNEATQRTLRITFRGQTLRASANQNFNQRSPQPMTSSIVQPETGAGNLGTGGGGGGSIGGIVGGVLAAVALIGIGAAAFIFIRRHQQQGLNNDNSQLYETMSNVSSQGAGLEPANFDNEVYGTVNEDAYDNFDSQPAASSSA